MKNEKTTKRKNYTVYLSISHLNKPHLFHRRQVSLIKRRTQIFVIILAQKNYYAYFLHISIDQLQFSKQKRKNLKRKPKIGIQKSKFLQNFLNFLKFLKSLWVDLVTIYLLMPGFIDSKRKGYVNNVCGYRFRDTCQGFEITTFLIAEP